LYFVRGTPENIQLRALYVLLSELFGVVFQNYLA
jgi:hypothetical protein